MVVKIKEDEDPMKGLNRGYFVTTVLAMIGFYISVYFLLGNNIWFFLAGVVGLITALAFVFVTQYYTEYRYRPVKSIAEASKTGAATNIIMGYSVSMECVGIPVLLICAALMASYQCGVQALVAMPGLQYRRAQCRFLRHGDGDDGYAGSVRVHSGDGYFRSDHRQCRWHYRNVGSTEGRFAFAPTGSIRSAIRPKLSPKVMPSAARRSRRSCCSAPISMKLKSIMVKRGITGVIRVDLSDVGNLCRRVVGGSAGVCVRVPCDSGGRSRSVLCH